MSSNLVLTAKRDIQVIATGRKEVQTIVWKCLYQTPTDLTWETMGIQKEKGFAAAKKRYTKWVRTEWRASYAKPHIRELHAWLKEHKAAGYTFEFGAT